MSPKTRSPQRQDLLDRLRRLRREDFHALLHHIGVDESYLPGREAPQVERAVALLTLLRSTDPTLARLKGALSWLTRRRLAWRLGVPAGLAGLLGAAVLLWRSGQPPPGPPDMSYLPGGTFRMGSTEEEIAAAQRSCAGSISAEACTRDLFERETPARLVHVSPFLLDNHEVTNAEFAAELNRGWSRALRVEGTAGAETLWAGPLLVAVLGERLSRHGGLAVGPDRVAFRGGAARRPLVQVTWHGARLYCAAREKRLPTEAEWEFAARGRRSRPYPFGWMEPRCTDAVVFGGGNAEQAGACHDRVTGPAPIPAERGPLERVLAAVRSWIGGSSSVEDRTPEGILGLGGNVAEWVEDRYAANYPVCAADCTDPVVSEGPAEPARRVVRGGDWYSVSVFTRAAGRRPQEEGYASDNVGFRCARAAPVRK
jgi:formylglycine-generating enzyme required for sulfatase activity